MAREPYRFISYDSRDEHLVQFYLRTINNAPYLQFTYISPRDKRWADIIETNDLIFFTQDNVDVGSAVIAAPYDSTNGFRLAEVPSPALVEGNYYGIDYSRDRPEDDRDIPIENRGWSPLYGLQYLTFDGTTYSLSNTATPIFAFRLVDWTSGRGTKPQTGYLGVNGIVGDVANAAILELPQGPRGESTKWTEGAAFPTENRVSGDMHLFSVAATGLTNYYEADGTTAKTTAVAGEAAQWDGTKWVFVMVIGTGGVAFDDTLELGNFERASGGAVAGHYFRSSDTRVDISHRNIDNEDKSTEIEAIAVGQGIVFGDKIFVVEWTNEQGSHREFNGFWANDEADTTAVDSQVAISVIRHELRMIRFITKEQIESKLGVVGSLKELVSDLHVTKEVGNFENVTDAAVAGIAHIASAGLLIRNIDFANLTYGNPSTTTSDGVAAHIVVRIAKSLGHIETQFRVSFNSDRIIFPIRGFSHEDANWYYYVTNEYQGGADTLFIQRRSTHTHTRYDGELGDPALAQVDARIPEHEDISGLENKVEDLEEKTVDVHIQKDLGDFANVTDSAVASIAGVQGYQNIYVDMDNGSFDWGTLSFQNPTINTPSAVPGYVIVVRIPKSLGRIETQFRVVENVASEVIQTLNYPAGSDATYNYYVAGASTAAARWTLQRRSTHTHTRWDGSLGDEALEQVDARIPEHEGIEGLGAKVADVEDRTSDLHVQDEVGDFANANDATKQGIGIVAYTANRVAVIGRTFDYTSVTWQVATVDIPDDDARYFVVVRVAKSEGRIESQFQLTSTDPEETGAWHLRRPNQEDANWYYYVVSEDEEYAWTLQRRTTHTHTRYDGELGSVALAQVDSRLPAEGGGGDLTRQEKEIIQALQNKTADLSVVTVETWTLATDAQFAPLAEGSSPLQRISARQVPTGVTGWTNDSTTTGSRTIIVRVPLNAHLADYRLLFGDSDPIRLDSYGVYATGTQYAYLAGTTLRPHPAGRIRLQHHGNATHTRFVGLLNGGKIIYGRGGRPADAVGNVGDAYFREISRQRISVYEKTAVSTWTYRGDYAFLPEFPATGSRDNKVPQFDGDNLIWQTLQGIAAEPPLVGVGAPTTSLGVNNQMYFDENNGRVYLKKSGTWTEVLHFVTEAEFNRTSGPTPNRGNSLPPSLPNKALYVLASDSHFSEEFFGFVPGRLPEGGAVPHVISGANVIDFGASLPTFGSNLPSIFRANRLASIIAPHSGGGATIAQRLFPRVIINKALFSDPTFSTNNVKIKARNAHIVEGATFLEAPLYLSTFHTAGNPAEMVVGGQTYIVFDIGNTLREKSDWIGFIDGAQQSAYTVIFQIFQDQGGTIRYLSDDNATAWVDGVAHPAGLYEGDANEHPIEAIVPPKAVWDDIVAKTDTFIRATGPNTRFGADGNKWLDIASGKGYIKQDGVWVLAVDFALQDEIETHTPYRWLAEIESFVGDATRAWLTDEIHLHGMSQLFKNNSNAKLNIHVSGTCSTGAASMETGTVTLSVRDSANSDTELGSFALTGSHTTPVSFSFSKTLTSMPSNAFRILSEIASAPIRNAGFPNNYYTLHDIEIIVAPRDNRSLPEFPAEGSRDNKVPKFNGDVLGWEEDAAGTGGGGAVSLIWADIPSNTTINRGTFVYHGDLFFGCIVTHTKSATGPDGDTTNWIILSNFAGDWQNKWYPRGTIVEHAGSPYVANVNVSRGDPQPNANDNVKWLRMDADLTGLVTTTALTTALADAAKVRYLKLSINSAITVPIPTAEATPLTYASSALASNEATGFLARNTAGNGITLKAGSYQVDCHVVITPSNVNERSSYTIEIYQGTTKLDETKYIDYIRAFNQLGPPEAIDSTHLITLASDGDIQIRIKMSLRGGSTLTAATAADGKVVVRKL